MINPKKKWVWSSAPTRYGKTETLALALLYLAAFLKLKIPIVAGTQEKAMKIMEYIVQHLPDHPVLYEGLINTDIEKVEQLKVTLSKSALRWYDGGWIYVTSVDARQVAKEGESVVGEGGDVVVIEEAGLIKEEAQFSKIVRMLEEDSGWGKLVMSGNTIEGSIFEKAYSNDLYHKVKIGLEQAIAEGRFSREFLEQKKTMTTGKDWKRYYLVEFPEADEFAYFKPSRYEILPKKLKYYGAIDPSLGETIKSSKSGIVVLGVADDNKRYEVDSIVKHLSPDEAIREIFNLPYTFERFYFEAIQFQKYFMKITKDLSREMGLNIPFEGITQARNKIERIESLEPAINTEQILFKGDNHLWSDMQSYPHIDYLDGLDALEMVYRGSIKRKPKIAVGEDIW